MILNSIDENSQKKLLKVDDKIIKEAISLLKPSKADSIFDMSSDFYRNAPPELNKHLTNLIKLYFSHGYLL